ncbi:MAG: hypothetical protein AVDCRST_MAG41-1723, partial [uncultured Corynebacteriales bacterium]
GAGLAGAGGHHAADRARPRRRPAPGAGAAGDHRGRRAAGAARPHRLPAVRRFAPGRPRPGLARRRGPAGRRAATAGGAVGRGPRHTRRRARRPAVPGPARRPGAGGGRGEPGAVAHRLAAAPARLAAAPALRLHGGGV